MALRSSVTGCNAPLFVDTRMVLWPGMIAVPPVPLTDCRMEVVALPWRSRLPPDNARLGVGDVAPLPSLIPLTLLV